MKKLFLGAMALLAAVTLVACGSKKDAYESIKENKKLVVAVSPDYACLLYTSPSPRDTR